MTTRTLTSPSGRTLHHVASRRTTLVEDRDAKELRILANKQKRLAENREYLKNADVRAYLSAIAAAEGGDYDLVPIPVGRRKRMAMHGKRGQGERRTHGWPCYDEQRRPRLSGAAAATPHYRERHLMYGGVRGKKNDRWRFSDFSTHPGPGIDGRTTAAGRYQINKANWKENGEKKMGLTDFSADTQDLIAVEAIRYAHALDDVIAGDIEPAARKTSTIWAAIPKGPGIPNDAGQPYMHYENFLKAFKENGGVAR